MATLSKRDIQFLTCPTTKHVRQQNVSKRDFYPEFECSTSRQVILPLDGNAFPLTLLDLKYDDDLFTYTRRRFLVDEKEELSERSLRFNVNELARTDRS
jgi:hypothetical protein